MPMKAGQSKQWLLAATILLVTLLAYQPVWHAGFIWDDDSWTTNISSLLRDVSGLQTIWCKPTALQQYYPLTATSFWIDYHLWTFLPLPYHIENVLLHAFAAVLFWRLLLRLEVPGAWLAGAIFALHPVMVESAAWVTERKNVLSLVLYLGALLAYGRFTSFWKEDKDSPPRGRAYCWALLLALGALLAKTTAISVPAVILLIGWWKRGRIRWRADVLPTLPFFALAIALSLVTVWMEKNHVGAQGPEWAISFPQRCLIAGRALWFYTAKLLWPVNLCFIYPRWQLNARSISQWLYPTTAAATLCALWFARRNIGRGPAAAAFFFSGTLFPSLGFMNTFFMRYSFVCDHWTYLSSLGLIALCAALVTRAANRLRAPVALYGFAAVILPLLMILTWRQARVYRNIEALWRDTLAKNPGCWMAHDNLSVILVRDGRLEEAMRHGEQALRLKPDDSEICVTLAGPLIQAGRFQEAIGYCQQAVRLAPTDSRAYNNLGATLDGLGKVEEAIQQFEQAVRLNPNDQKAHVNLGRAFEKTGRTREAIFHYEEVWRIEPNDSAIQNNLAWLLATRPPAEGGDPVRAVALAERACSLTTNSVFAYLDTLAAAYAAAGRFSEAVATAQKAVQLAHAANQPQAANEIAARLELYRHGRAYHESKPSLASP